MPRDQNPPELSPLQRTALWVQAQAALAQPYPDSQPPSPARSSTKTSSSYRTTTSSDETSLKPSLARTSSMQQQPSTHKRAPSTTATHRPQYDSRSRRSSLPFPQSPPGSGYPMALDVAPPRRPEGEDRKTQTPRPSLRKQRRPSLIDQIISLGSSSSQRRREEPGKKA